MVWLTILGTVTHERYCLIVGPRTIVSALNMFYLKFDLRAVSHYIYMSLTFLIGIESKTIIFGRDFMQHSDITDGKNQGPENV